MWVIKHIRRTVRVARQACSQSSIRHRLKSSQSLRRPMKGVLQQNILKRRETDLGRPIKKKLQFFILEEMKEWTT